jgi:hypothetical protein
MIMARKVLCLLRNSKANEAIVAKLAIRQRNVSQSKLKIKNHILWTIIASIAMDLSQFPTKSASVQQ